MTKLSVMCLFVLLSLLSLLTATNGFAGIETKDYDLAPIHAFTASGSFDIEYVQGQDQVVQLTGDSKTLKSVAITLDNGVLKLEFKSLMLWSNCPEECKVKAYIVTKALDQIEISGAAKLTASAINAPSLKFGVNGSVNAKLKGVADDFTIVASGSVKLDAAELIAKDVSITTSGSVDTEAHALESLDIKISGNGNVRYLGAPKHIETDIAGSGHVASHKG